MPLIPVLPTLVSITGTDPSSTDASVVHYTVTFPKPVSGVTVDQFTLAIVLREFDIGADFRGDRSQRALDVGE